MNQGLKNYTKQLPHDVSGVGELYINLNSVNRNTNLVLPLISTRGQNPIELSLVYNHLDRNDDSGFGKGFKINYFYSLSSDESGMFFISCDGSKDYASMEGNNETNTILDIEVLNSYNVYTQTTLQGNKSYHNSSGDKYPCKIRKYNGDEIIINDCGGGNVINKIENGYNDVVNFIYTTNAVEIDHYYNNVLMQKVILQLSNQKLFKVSIYEGDSILVNEYTLDYQDTQIEVSNLIKKNSTKVVMDGSYTRIYDGYEEGYGTSKYDSVADLTVYYVTMSSYGPNETRVFDRFNNYIKYFFDSNQLLTQETDKYNKSIFYQYNANTKKLIYCSQEPINIINNIGSEITFNLTSSNNSIDNTLGLNDPANINSEIWNKLAYYNVGGESSKTISLSGTPFDLVTLSFYLATYAHAAAGDVVVTLEAGGSSVSKTFTNETLNNLEIHTLAVTPKEKYDTVKVTLKVLSGSIVRIGAYTLLCKAFNKEFDYSSGLLQTIQSGVNNTSFEYNSQNKLSAVKKNDEYINQISYHLNSLASSSVNKYGTVTERMYDETYPKLLRSLFTRNASDNIGLGQGVSYKNGRLISWVSDENNIANTYCYDGLERLEKIQDSCDNYIENEYYGDTSLLKSITLGLSSASNTYEYDDRRRIKKVTTADQTYYDFEYTTRNKISKIKLNGKLIYEYTYDNADNILTIAYGNNGDFAKYQFAYNSDGSLSAVSLNNVQQFTYSYSEGKLISVTNKLKLTTKTYNYDEYDRLVSVSDSQDGTPVIISNVFDKDNKLLGTKRVVNNVGLYESYDDLERSESLAPVTVDNVKEILFAQTNLEGCNSSILNSFEIIPLHHNFDSLKGTISPSNIFLPSVNTKPFIYNSKNGRYCLSPSSAEVKYNFGNSTSGTIFLRVYNASSGAEHVIFEMKDTSGKTITLVINSSQKYALKIDGVEVLVGPTYSSGNWQTVGLAYYQTFTGYYSSTYKLFVDGDTYTASKQQSSSYGNFTTYLGRTSSLSQVFRGQFEMMAVANSYIITNSVLTSLKNELNIVTSKTTIDEFERVVRKEVKKENNNIVSNNYAYKTFSSGYYEYTFRLITKETIAGGNNSAIATREYDYDELGRVKSIEDSVFGSKSYEYNDRGFLENDNGTAITYTGNGNVASYGTKTFSYDEYGRLQVADGTTILYSYFNPLYPTSIGSNTLTWSGKRLTRYTYSSGYYEFEYNDEGLRTSKENHQGIQTKYFYDGSRLVTEIKGSQRLDFVYDEQGLLYGLVLNNTTKYFYVRDILQNILGLVDESGTLVVKYSYNAFGAVTIVSDTSGVSIGSINPFRYKGYYYDVETQLFYCNSRYYSPELCRWISPDSIEYLEPSSINGLNLYAYCGNDSVNRFDPTGHVFISVLVGLGIAALIGAGIGAASYTAGQLIDYAITGDFEWSWGGFIGSTVGGAIGGAITFATAGIGGAFATMAGAFLSGAAMTSITMIGENISGDATYSFGDILISSLISGGISMASVAIMSKIKIPSLNSGRGSMSAVSKQMYTKFQRQIIKRVSMRTFAKMLAVEAYNGAAGNIMEWVYDISGAKDFVLSFF